MLRVLVKRGSNQVHNTIPKFWKWLIVNYMINVTIRVLSRFYIIGSLCQNLQIRGMHGNAKKVWVKCFLFNKFLFFSKRFILSGIFFNNYHLLILDGHGPHVMGVSMVQCRQKVVMVLHFSLQQIFYVFL
jgi:hypothetical protein